VYSPPSRSLEEVAITKEIALIELGDSHEDILHSQVRFLQWGGYRVHLLIAAELEPRLPATGADVLQVLPPLGSWGGRARALLSLRRYLHRHGLRRVILSTAQGARARDFCWTGGAGLELTGILHNARKLAEGSFTQRLISRRVRSYFVLADYILASLREAGYAGRVQSIHPVFYPEAPPDTSSNDPETLQICIPGAMSYRRRDYAGLHEALSSAPIAEGVRLVFLGDSDRGDGPAIRRRFRDWEDRGACRFFRGFVAPGVFYAELAGSHLILPLIHPSTPLFQNYLAYQISGTFLLAFGFRKPMLLYEAFEGKEDFRGNTLFYRGSGLVPTVNRLVRDRAPLEACRAALISSDRFTFEAQARRYLDFVEGN